MIYEKIQIVLFPIQLIIFQNLEKYTWKKESSTLKRKLEKSGSNDNKIKEFYWKRDMKINSIKLNFMTKPDSKKHQIL